MRLFVLLALIAPLGCGQANAEIRGASRALDQALLSQVVGAGLEFIAPRTLDENPVSRMALWGMRGLTAIDPGLTPDLKGDGKAAVLRLLGADMRELFVRPPPPEADATAWGTAVGQVTRAAWDASAAVRRAGTPGVIESFYDELFNHLDPYSRYAPPREADADRVRRAGRGGIGLTVIARGTAIVITGVQAGSPAAQAGIRVGEQVIAVDGAGVQGADGTAVAALLAGPETTRVSVTLRGRDGRSRSVAMERARVPPETVTARRAGDLLVLRISGFSRSTGARVAQELIRGVGEKNPPRGVVLDLRGNRGGVLQQAVSAAAMLQAEGVVAVTEGRDPDAAHTFLASGRDLARFLPVVVLVDGGSASAAEILAASLADQRRAVVVGSATLGKGLVQTVSPLPDGGELLVTWSRVLAPRHWPIQGLGVLPQVCTSLGQEVLDRHLGALANGTNPMAAELARHRAARAPLSPSMVLEIRAACPAAQGDYAGDDTDLAAARFLIATPGAYAAALLAVAEQSTAEAPRANDLTGRAAVRN